MKTRCFHPLPGCLHGRKGEELFRQLLAVPGETVSGSAGKTQVRHLDIDGVDLFFKVSFADPASAVLRRNLRARSWCATPELEARNLLHLSSLGFDVIPVLAAGSGYRMGFPQAGFMLTEGLAGESLELRLQQTDSPALWEAYGALVGRLHGHGYCEPLRAKDVLLVDGRMVLMDREQPPVRLGEKRVTASLKRMVARNVRSGLTMSDTAADQWLTGYAAQAGSRHVAQKALRG